MEHDKKGGKRGGIGRKRMSRLFLFSFPKLSAKLSLLSSHRPPSSRFHSASMIVITLFRLTSSNNFLETNNDNEGGRVGRGKASF